MPTLFGYWFPLPGQSLMIELYGLAGGNLVNSPGGDALTDSGSPPGYYTATVAQPLPPKVRVLVKRSGNVVDLLTHIVTPNSVQDLNSGTIEAQVTSLSASAISQLAGQAVVASIPTWDVEGFDRPLVRGDSYTGSHVLTIRLTGWTGPVLSSASSIVLSAVRRPQNDAPFSWPVAVAADADDWILTLDLDTGQTAQAIGLYDFDVEATFPGGIKHTLVGPGARLQFIDDQTK